MTKRIRFSPFARAGVFAAGLALAASHASATDVPFSTRPPISGTANGARSVVAADVDGDGDQDVLSASSFDNKIAWYENTAGDGTAWTPRTISTAALGALSVFAADLDGDGDVDALSTSLFDSKLAWYENTAGNGSAWTLHTISIPADPPNYALAADLDGDGDLDVLCAGPTTVTWHENTAGNGSAWTLHTITTVAPNAFSVFAADVDGDGDMDALSASISDDKVAWYENTAGNGSAWALRTISTAADGAWAVFAADLDGDGDVDALSASQYDAKVAWYENTAGNGTSWTPHIISTATGEPSSVFAADFDGDGDQDVLSASLADGTVSWHENTAGNGSAWTLRTISFASASAPRSVFAADLDGDGDADALSAFANTGTIAWYRDDTIHESACFVTPPPVSTTADATWSVVVGDVDGDGDLDALSASRYDDKVAWYENTAGNGSAWTLHTISTTADFATAVFAADVDDDGDLDTLSASVNDDKIAWYENTAGNGTAWTLHTISTAADGAFAVFAADLDGDGDLDALSASRYDNKIAWYENSAGNGTAWILHTISTAATFATSVFAADVDGDGDPDALSASILDNKIAWYENSAGNGTAWILHTISTAAIQAFFVSAADVDGDGDLDVLSASLLDDTVAWYENTTGGGTAWIPHTISTTGDSPRSVFAADLDGDGDLDVLAASGNDDKVVWYENSAGNGSAWSLHTISTVADEVFGVIAADVDGDGSLDVLSASNNDDKIAWYDNQGGQFSLTVSDTAPAGAVNSELVAMLSVVATHAGRAGDGDLELARLGLLFEEAPGDPLTSAEANALIESLRVYRDANGNGTFDPASDVLVATLPTVALTNGIQVVSFADADPNVQVAFGTPRTYFVVTELTANASQQTPNQFRVTHLGLGASASTAEDRTYDIPLRPACPADVSSSVVGPITPVELLGFTVE